jgi:formylglycine-generating enzyme required for sulfatase activity
MSPEQIQGGIGKEGRGELDGRSDLYSVGVLLYQLLTGVLPFSGRNNMSVLMAHLYQAPPPMNEANPKVEIPPRVERLVMSCLERDPDLRPQTAHELAERFRAAIADVPRPLPGPRPGPVRAAGLVAIALVVVGVLAVGGLGVYKRFLHDSRVIPSEAEIAKGDRTRDPIGTTPGADRRRPGVAPRRAWAPKDYEPLTSKELEAIALGRGKAFTPGKASGDLEDAPAGLRHERKGDVFYAFAPGIYLPLGYLPEDPDDIANRWPKILVRKSDNIRFIRIAGDTYRAGDFTAETPDNDPRGNPIQVHDVKLSGGFYIQETEVTNREIRGYRGRFPDEPRLENWENACKVLGDSMPADQVDRCPAVFLDRVTAQKYARWVGGRLPTEAEWEYVARSCGKNHKWASSSAIAAKQRNPKAHLLLPAAPQADPFSRPVKSFPEDRTDQGVFDMTGNVQEWCLDSYRPYAELIAEMKNPGQPWPDPCVGEEPSPAEPKAEYIVRGGSYYVTANEAKVFKRYPTPADSQLDYVGFRVVIPCPPEFGEPAE